MTAYLFIQLKVTDKPQFLRYAAVARDIAVKYGGQYLSVGRPLEVLEGTGITTAIVLTAWPSADHIRAFWQSPDYRAAVALRVGAVEVSATILDGTDAPPSAP
jgi:uncharacterized protein (DUF1330 family)